MSDWNGEITVGLATETHHLMLGLAKRGLCLRHGISGRTETFRASSVAVSSSASLADRRKFLASKRALCMALQETSIGRALLLLLPIDKFDRFTRADMRQAKAAAEAKQTKMFDEA